MRLRRAPPPPRVTCSRLPRAFRPSLGRCCGPPAAGLVAAADLIRVVLAGTALTGTALDGTTLTRTALTRTALDGTELHGTTVAY